MECRENLQLGFSGGAFDVSAICGSIRPRVSRKIAMCWDSAESDVIMHFLCSPRLQVDTEG